jgi:hypothetical protein
VVRHIRYQYFLRVAKVSLSGLIAKPGFLIPQVSLEKKLNLRVKFQLNGLKTYRKADFGAFLVYSYALNQRLAGIIIQGNLQGKIE